MRALNIGLFIGHRFGMAESMNKLESYMKLREGQAGIPLVMLAEGKLMCDNKTIT